jgi:hypothetical protein
MSDLNFFLREMLFKTYHEEQIRLAENARLILQIRSQPTKRITLHCRVLVWLGKRLVTLGTGLQKRFNTNALNTT